jgi:hypothetical protein
MAAIFIGLLIFTAFAFLWVLTRKGVFGGPLSRSGFILDFIDATSIVRRKRRRG